MNQFSHSLLPTNMQSKITVEEHCWTWHGGKTSSGYGCFGYEGRIWLSHRLAYTLLVDEIPAGLQIDHLCLNKLCCNPAHLEPVTGTQNINRRAIARRGSVGKRGTDDPGYVPIVNGTPTPRPAPKEPVALDSASVADWWQEFIQLKPKALRTFST